MFSLQFRRQIDSADWATQFNRIVIDRQTWWTILIDRCGCANWFFRSGQFRGSSQTKSIQLHSDVVHERSKRQLHIDIKKKFNKKLKIKRKIFLSSVFVERLHHDCSGASAGRLNQFVEYSVYFCFVGDLWLCCSQWAFVELCLF